MLTLAILAGPVGVLLGFAVGASFGGRHTAQQSARANQALDDVEYLKHRLAERNELVEYLADDARHLRRALAGSHTGEVVAP